jgi:aspartate racemase
MRDKKIGIIGGVGPYAGVDLVKKIMDNTIAVTDYDHIPVYLLSDPLLVPDRTNFLTGVSQINPAYGIIEGFSKLKELGAEVVAIACNAAHSPRIMGEVEKWNHSEGSLQIVNIVRETIQALTDEKNKIRNVATLSVAGTYHSRVFENALSDAGYHVVELGDQMKKEIHETIWSPDFGIKAFSNPVKEEAIQRLKNIIRNLSEKRADTVILACTEIPLAIQEKKIHGCNIVDPTTILARALIRESNSEKLSKQFTVC